MKDLEDMNLSAMQYRDEQRNEFTQVTAQCKCGRGGWLRLPKHPDLDSYIPKQELSRLLEDEPVGVTHDEMAVPIIKNGLRAELKKELGL